MYIRELFSPLPESGLIGSAWCRSLESAPRFLFPGLGRVSHLEQPTHNRTDFPNWMLLSLSGHRMVSSSNIKRNKNHMPGDQFIDRLTGMTVGFG